MSRKRDTFMAGRAPYHPQAPDIEAAKHLRSMAAAYVKRRVPAGDVVIAINEFLGAIAKAEGGES